MLTTVERDPFTMSTTDPPASSHSHSTHSTLTTANANETSTDATTKLAEAIDDFLGDLEKKFKGISDEILGRLDDMAERCDRLEQEMVLRESSAQVQSSGETGVEGEDGR